MKEFPPFTESQITIELKQFHLKLVFVAMQALLTRFDADMPAAEFKSLIDTTIQRQGIKFPSEFTQDQSSFQNQLELANDALMDAYVQKKSIYTDKFIDEVNALFNENYDREIFDLANGETLKIADSGSVYG
jgi:hypothetical protein